MSDQLPSTSFMKAILGVPESQTSAAVTAVFITELEKRLHDENERLRESQERLKSAIEFAHSEGFQWPSDPMAEFV